MEQETEQGAAELAWFEGLVAQLAKDPRAAGPALLALRRTDGAHELCLRLLRRALSPAARFQALLVLRATLVTRWRTFSPQAIADFQMFLWELIASDSVQEAYVLNKLIQVYAVAVKKSWMADGEARRAHYFELVEAVSGGGSVRALYVASKVLRALVESLALGDGLDEGLSREQLGRLRRAFLAGGTDGAGAAAGAPSGLLLAARLSISVLQQIHALTAPFDACVAEQCGGAAAAAAAVVTISDGQLLDLAHGVAEIAEAVGCVLRVCESSASSAMDGLGMDGAVGVGGRGFSAVWAGGSGGSGGSGSAAATPNSSYSWLPLLLSTDMLGALFQLHRRLRSVLLAMHFPAPASSLSVVAGGGGGGAVPPKDLSESLCAALQSVSQMLLGFASVDAGVVFPTGDHKAGFAEALLAGALDFLEASVGEILVAGQRPPTPGEGLLPFSLLFFMKDDGEYALQEFSHCADLLMRIFGNFKLSLVSSLPSFERAMASLARVTGSAAGLLLRFSGPDCGAGAYGPGMTALSARYAQLVDMSDADSLLASPLIVVVMRCVDVWSLLLGDSVLAGAALSLSEGEGAVAARLRTGLRALCGPMFEQLFQCVVVSVIQDTLRAEEEELDVEGEEIIERALLELVRGVADVGRLALASALQHVCAALEASVRRLEDMMLHMGSGSGSDAALTEPALRAEVTRQLEVQRLSAEFLSCLLIEADAGRDRGYSTGAGAGGGGSSSEIPLIPGAVLDASSGAAGGGGGGGGGEGGGLVELIIRAVGLVLQTLQQQCRFHQTYAESASLSPSAALTAQQSVFLDAAVSHLVAQEILFFLRDYIWAYVDPSRDMYETDPATLCPALADAMSPAGSFDASFLDPVLQMAYYCAVRLGSGDDALVAAGLGALRGVARLRARLPRLGALPSMQRFVAHARGTVCPTAEQAMPDHSLSTANQATLWQNIGYISHEMAAGGGGGADAAGAVETGTRYLGELCSSLHSGAEYCSHIVRESSSNNGSSSSNSNTSPAGGAGSGSAAAALMHCVAAYRGLARCSVSLSPDVLSFFDASLPGMYALVHEVVVSSIRNGNIGSGARLLSEWLGLLADFAESTPLSSLPQACLAVLMALAQGTLLNTVFNLLSVLQPCYQGGGGGGAAPASPASLPKEDKDMLSHMFVEILSGALVYLDHIASSDVAVCMRPGAAAADAGAALYRPLGMHARAASGSGSGCGGGGVEVDALLCTALLMLSSTILSGDIISSFKTIRDKYLSIVNLTLRSHPCMLGVQWLSLGQGLAAGGGPAEAKLDTLRVLLQQVLGSVDAADSSAGRVALLALKSFGVFYKKISAAPLSLPPSCDAQLSASLVNESAQLFLHLSLSHLLGMMLPAPAPSPQGQGQEGAEDALGPKSPLLLLKDRTDTFASTLLELVQIDSGQRYVNLLLC
jgi:hypothetical protein